MPDLVSNDRFGFKLQTWFEMTELKGKQAEMKKQKQATRKEQLFMCVCVWVLGGPGPDKYFKKHILVLKQ